MGVSCWSGPGRRIGSRTLGHVGRWGACAVLLTLIGLAAAPLAVQTIRGTLMEVGTDRPVPTGDLFLLLAESGDTVATTTTDAGGAFALTAPEPGSFLLRASPVGRYRSALLTRDSDTQTFREEVVP